MATDKDFVTFIVDQIDDSCDITSKSMFGEYGMWSHGKIVALICDNKLFIKPTNAGRAYIGKDIVEASPYPGAKPFFLIEDQLDNKEWLSELIRVSEAELPKPKPKRKAKKKSKK